jgi:hypothetical protein
MKHPADHEGTATAANATKASALTSQPLDADTVYSRMNSHEVCSQFCLAFSGPKEVILRHIHTRTVFSYSLDEGW